MATTNIQTFSGDVDVTSNILMSGEVFIKTNDGNGKVGIGLNAGETSQGVNAVAVGRAASQYNQGSNAVAVGREAGRTSQGVSAVAVGYLAGKTSQGVSAVAVGRQAGQTSQAKSAVAVGNNAGNTSQGAYAVAMGYVAGLTSQGASATAVGNTAGQTSQGNQATAVGTETGRSNQGLQSTAVGHAAGNASQGASATAVGSLSGFTAQGGNATAVGRQAGQTSQGASAVAVGHAAGETAQSDYATAVGVSAGQTSQGSYATAVGRQSGMTSQSDFAVAIGNRSGEDTQGTSAIAVGYLVGRYNQGVSAVAVGNQAGQTSQGNYAAGVGYFAGETSQGTSAIAVGYQAGRSYQGSSAVAVGREAGQTSQGDFAVAVGRLAGQTSQSTNAIAVGRGAGQSYQGSSATAVGFLAGLTSQGDYATALGVEAGKYNQGDSTVAVGDAAGESSQGNNAVAMGTSAGRDYQGQSAVALGDRAGQTSQTLRAVAIGGVAGYLEQGNYAVAIGWTAGSNNQGGDAVAVGREAGQTSQGGRSVAIGNQAGRTSQGLDSVAVGVGAGESYQTPGASALGPFAGRFNQDGFATAVGYGAGNTSQGNSATAVGYDAGESSQGTSAVAVGSLAGQTSQGTKATAVGYAAGQSYQGGSAVAVGNQAGQRSQGASAVAVGVLAGETSQGTNAVAVGYSAGQTDQGNRTVAVGISAGQYNQGSRAVAVGEIAGQTSQGSEATALGYLAGQSYQGNYATAVGVNAGLTSQGVYAVAVGYSAGQTDQGNRTVAVGISAGQYNQGSRAVAVGEIAGQTSQGLHATAMGYLAGESYQGNNAVAVGYSAGRYNQGLQAVAVGYSAGQTDQHDNSIVLNASGAALDTVGTGRTYIKPLRVATVASNVMTYDQTTGEVMDSGGLFTNRLAVVSEQPPSALTGATTVVDGHGRYKVTSSLEAGSYQAWKCFNKVSGNANGDAWSTGTGYYDSNGTHIGDGTLGGVDGEWLKLEMPYKTKLRHISLTPRSTSHYAKMPEVFTILGSNDDSSWTTLKALTGQTWTSPNDVKYVIDASASYKYYAIVVEETNGDFATIGEWRLFTESFSVEGGIVTTTAASGLETGFTEHPVAPMTGFNTYVEGHGTYEASASSFNSTLYPWESFDYNTGSRWATNTVSYSTSSPYENLSSYFTTDVGGTRYNGEWMQLKVPYPIVLSHSNVYPTGTSLTDRAPGAGVILGSNDGENWYKLTEFSGKTYTPSTWTRIDVNATTPYQYFRMCVTNLTTYVSQGGYLEFTEWRLFSATGVTKMDNVLISGELAVDGGALQTSHIKWPKVPLKANESEGYVASVSSLYSSTHSAFNAFEDKSEYTGGTAPAWISDSTSFPSGSAAVSRTTGEDTFNHEWLQIQLPQAIQLSHFNILRRDTALNRVAEAPKSGFMYGSNDGVTWTKLVAYSDLTYVDYQPTRVNVQSTIPYTYYRLAVTVTVGSVGFTAINELQLFESTLGVGTSATTAKLTVDGGLGLAKGSQVFAGDDVVMELPKHDRPLVKYPEVAMTANSSGGYVASASSDAGSNYRSYKAFDGTGSFYITGGINYNTSNGSYTGSNTFEGIPGETLSLTIPKKIKLQHIRIRARTGSSSDNAPKKARIFGSNDNSTWVQLWTFDEMGLDFTNGTYKLFVVNAEQYYNTYTFVIEEGDMEYGTTNAYVSIRELEYWGTEEGDESVDVVHRSIPNTPGQQQLAVYYEARDPNSYSFADSSNVYDLSGSGVTGTLTGGVGYDAVDNAFTFDGVNDYVESSITTLSGDQIHSISFWLKLTNSQIGSVRQDPFLIGNTSNAPDKLSGMLIQSDNIYWYFSGNDIIIPSSSLSLIGKKWYNITLVYTGGGGTIANRKIYIDGLAYNGTITYSGVGYGNILAFDSSTSKIRIGKSTTYPFNGSIANFRLYSKALSADQVRELYEYDAERFGHRQNLVALHKGNLGVGVTNPTSRFEVAGADGLQEYPPKAMTGYETYIEGHGVFRANWANWYSGNTPWGMYTKTPNAGGQDNRWYGPYNGSNGYSGGYVYSGTDFAASTTSGLFLDDVNGNRYYGAWTTITMPYDITLKRIHLYQAATTESVNSRCIPEDGVILGSDNGNDWYHIHTFTGLTYGGSVGTYSYSAAGESVVVNANRPYKHYALVTTRTLHNDFTVLIGELYWFGTPAPSSLEDGHLTLGKALTAPRVSGHPAGAETPRAESLVVHYDTTVDSVVSGSTVVDISGEGNNGTFNGNASYSSTDRALVFDGTGDYVDTSVITPSMAGAQVHSMSAWFKSDTASDLQFVTCLGEKNGGGAEREFSAIRINGSTLQFWSYSNDLDKNNAISAGVWYHVVAVYLGGGTSQSTMLMYLNGERITSWDSDTTDGKALNLVSPSFAIGEDIGRSDYRFDGLISNPKLWNVALTAEEVAMEYALGRTGKSLNITDTALCIGGTVPSAQLDVRGNVRGSDNVMIGPYGGQWWRLYTFQHNGNLGFIGEDGTEHGYLVDSGTVDNIDFTGQHRSIVDKINVSDYKSLEGLIVSANKNKYINVDKDITTGSNAIQISQSLPVVSLSNIVHDKACYGVVAGSEDPDSRTYEQGTFVSVFRKQKGDTRAFINSVGEGAMWVVNTAGALESGDYITTSNVAGYGQKQESDSLKNYTVAKITMDCDFEPATQPIQRIKQSNVVETHYTGLVSVVKGVPHEWVTTTVTADDEWSNVSVSPSDVTYAEWSNLEANVQNTYTLTYTQTSNVVYDVKYTKTTTANVTAQDAWDAVHIEPSTVTYAEYSNLEANVQNTYSLTYTMTTKVEATEAIYSNLSTEDKEFFIPTYYHMVEQTVDAEYPGAVKHETVTDRLENALDEHGQLQWEDDPSGAMEKAYKIRYLDASGQITDEANAVHTAAFVGVTYHCG
jgi:hypothetical protein